MMRNAGLWLRNELLVMEGKILRKISEPVVAVCYKTEWWGRSTNRQCKCSKK